MIWDIVSSRSCFWWLYGASPSLAAKNITSIISVLTIWWCSCAVISCVVGRGCLLWPAYCHDKTLLAFALIHFYSKVKPACYSGYLLTSCFCIPIPYDEKDISFFFFLMLVLEGVVGLQGTGQLQLLRHQWLGHRLGLLWCWMVCLEMNWDHFVVFEVAPNTAFELLLTMRATPFLLRDSCPQ